MLSPTCLQLTLNTPRSRVTSPLYTLSQYPSPRKHLIPPQLPSWLHPITPMSPVFITGPNHRPSKGSGYQPNLLQKVVQTIALTVTVVPRGTLPPNSTFIQHQAYIGAYLPTTFYNMMVYQTGNPTGAPPKYYAAQLQPPATGG